MKSLGPVFLFLGLVGCSSAPPEQCLGTGDDAFVVLGGHLTAEEKAGFSGAVALHTSAGPWQWASAGHVADRTGFWLASISKALTATAAVRLAEQGRLDLDATVAEAFPAVSGALGDRRLVELLGHRAGLPHAYAPECCSDIEGAVAAISDLELGEAGKFFYSNDGYSLAAAMMQRLTGIPFESLIREEIAGPAGVGDLWLWGDAVDRSRFGRFPQQGQPLVLDDGQTQPNWGYRGATGMGTTAAGLLRFLRAVRLAEVVSPAGRDLLWTPRWQRSGDERPTGRSYGLGWALEVVDGQVIQASHGGTEDWLNHNGVMQTRTDGTLDLVVLSDGGMAGDVSWARRVAQGVELCLSGVED